MVDHRAVEVDVVVDVHNAVVLRDVQTLMGCWFSSMRPRHIGLALIFVQLHEEGNRLWQQEPLLLVQLV